MINRNFVSPSSAITFLREEGFKPITQSPRIWKKVENHQIREVNLHVFGAKHSVKIVEVSHVSR